MTLLEFCIKKYGSDDRWKYNYIVDSRNNTEEVKGMLSAIYGVWRYNFSMLEENPHFNAVLEYDTLENDQLVPNHIIDHFALVFDVITKQNGNPNLWSNNADITNELIHTFNVLYHGKNAEMYSDGKGGALGKMTSPVDYETAVEIFLEELKPPLFLF